MSDSAAIANKLGEHLDASYFPEAIKWVHELIDHVISLEKQVVNLKQSLAHAVGAPNMGGALGCAHPGVPYMISDDGSELPVGAVVIDEDGDAWQRTPTGLWGRIPSDGLNLHILSEEYGPYCVIYIPEGGDES